MTIMIVILFWIHHGSHGGTFIWPRSSRIYFHLLNKGQKTLFTYSPTTTRCTFCFSSFGFFHIDCILLLLLNPYAIIGIEFSAPWNFHTNWILNWGRVAAVHLYAIFIFTHSRSTRNGFFGIWTPFMRSTAIELQLNATHTLTRSRTKFNHS